MKRLLPALLAILLVVGCERNAVGPDARDQGRPVTRVVVIEGFGGVESEVTASNIVRIPGYYDLSEFDSIAITFTAERVTSAGAMDHILVKVGPMCYRGDSLAVPRKDFAIRVTRSDLSKPAMCALSFLCPDPGARLLLSRLTVVGWTAG